MNVRMKNKMKVLPKLESHVFDINFCYCLQHTSIEPEVCLRQNCAL